MEAGKHTEHVEVCDSAKAAPFNGVQDASYKLRQRTSQYFLLHPKDSSPTS